MVFYINHVVSGCVCNVQPLSLAVIGTDSLLALLHTAGIISMSLSFTRRASAYLGIGIPLRGPHYFESL